MLIQQIVDLLRTEGPMSRAELSRRSQVSKPTVSTVAKTLLAAKLIYENGLMARSGGRPAKLLHFNAEAGYVIGMDVGGTRARAAIADLLGNILALRSETTQAQEPEKLIAQLHGLCLDLTRARGADLAQVTAIAIGTPGVIDPESGDLRYAHNLPALERRGTVQRLRRTLEAPVFLLNDVNLAALGERWRGAAQALQHFVFISIGTGFGFVLVAGGELYEGWGGRAGEFGYVPFPAGRGATLEARLSGPGLSQRHRAAGGSGKPEDAFLEAERGLEPGKGVVQDFLDDLAWTVAALATVLDPECVILGGGLGVRCEPYLAALNARLAALTPIVPKLRISLLHGDAGLNGAVATALAASRSVDKWLEGGFAQRQLAPTSRTP